MGRILKSLIFGVALLFIGCDTIYEYPDENPADPTAIAFTINVELNLDLEFDFEHEVTTRSLAQDKILSGHKVRLIMEVYPDKYPGFDLVDPEIYKSNPYTRQELIFDNMESLEKNIDVQLKLSPKPYIFLVWVDYLHAESGNNYYDADRLHTIQLPNQHVSNTHGRDAFVCNKRLDLSRYSGEWNVKLIEKFTLHRPLARYELFTDDIEKYIEQQTKGGKASDVADLNDYTVKVSYRGYLPTGFDAITDKPDDARTGITYDAKLTSITDTSAIIAFDHILTNGADSFVTVDIHIYNVAGVLVNESNGIRIPYRRNVMTKVHGSFLTKSYDSGVTIDPDYDGEFDIYL